MTFQHAWPVIFGIIALANVLEALFRKRVFLFIKRDPDTAIYRDYEPVSYWMVVGFYAAVAALVVASLLRSLSGD